MVHNINWKFLLTRDDEFIKDPRRNFMIFTIYGSYGPFLEVKGDPVQLKKTLTLQKADL